MPERVAKNPLHPLKRIRNVKPDSAVSRIRSDQSGAAAWTNKDLPPGVMSLRAAFFIHPDFMRFSDPMSCF